MRTVSESETDEIAVSHSVVVALPWPQALVLNRPSLGPMKIPWETRAAPHAHATRLGWKWWRIRLRPHCLSHQCEENEERSENKLWIDVFGHCSFQSVLALPQSLR